MSSTSGITPTNNTVTIPTGPNALIKYLQQNGKFPPITLSIFPLEQNQKNNAGAGTAQLYVDKFTSYSFQSSMLIPVDTFQCEFYYEKIQGIAKPQGGDIVVLSANGIPISTGIIDQCDMETDGSAGTRLTIQGRDLLSQWEDQDAVSLDSSIIWGNKYNILQIVNALAVNTRVNPKTLIQRNAPKRPYLFATQPGESKISAMQRYCESLDIYFWMSGGGNLLVGKPDMYGINTGGRQGNLSLIKSQRLANVLSMRSTRNPTQIPNMILPIWNGQETVQNRISKSQFLKNGAPGPARLLALGHRTPKAIIVSTPEGASPQDLSELNALQVAGQNTQNLTKAGASTILQVYAKREMARANIRDLQVQTTVPGHFNDKASPYQIDSVYRIQYEVDDVDEDMYLYEVDYTMNETEGQRTRLFFCRQTSLVSDVKAL